MRRASCLVVLAALLAALVSLGDRSPGEARAAGQTCREHTKHLVKHAKRHGKRVRIVRPKHFWTCADAPAPASSPAPGPVSGASSTAAVPDTPSPIPAPLAAPAIEAPPVVPPLPPEGEPPAPEPEANAVGVLVDDHALPFTYLPSRTEVRAGRLTVQLNNQGEDPHNMLMEKVGPDGEVESEVIAISPKTEPGKQTTKSVEVEPGTYRMWCSFEKGKHAEEGMETTITVAG